MMSEKPSDKTCLWRTTPPRRPLLEGDQPFPLDYVFPSGRQLLSHILHLAGLNRLNRTAFPEWSSHCVVSAVARYSTPIPFNEAFQYGIKTDAVLIYEQWGWPVPAHAMEQLRERIRNAVFILDMVDSAHFRPEGESEREGFRAFFRFTSLSKLLGLPGGGIGMTNRKYVRFSPEEESEDFLAVLEKNRLIDDRSHGFTPNLVKDNITALSTPLRAWLNGNDLWKAIDEELAARQSNLRKVMDTSLTASWPSWMRNAVEDGAGPGIAPLLRGHPEETLSKARETLLKNLGIETEIYHFNWTGNPLEPSYEKCLAFPVHGMVRDIENILNIFMSKKKMS